MARPRRELLILRSREMSKVQHRAYYFDDETDLIIKGERGAIDFAPTLDDLSLDGRPFDASQFHPSVVFIRRPPFFILRPLSNGMENVRA